VKLTTGNSNEAKMKVTCKINSGKDLQPRHFRVFRGETDQAIYYVSIGKTYSVSAIALWESAVIFLVLDDTGKPNWYSEELFSISDPRLPIGWLFSTTVANEDGVQAILGYPRITSDPNHYRALIERDPEALKEFRAGTDGVPD
jgi:hypothetical protein